MSTFGVQLSRGKGGKILKHTREAVTTDGPPLKLSARFPRRPLATLMSWMLRTYKARSSSVRLAKDLAS